MLFDSSYYGKPTNAPLNIVWYNVFTGHGPDLYGTEPWHFYLVNGFLNFNVAFVLALAVLPLVTLVALVIPTPAEKGPQPRAEDRPLPRPLILLGLFLWLGVFVAQPHKEERFLFPAYPLLAVAAAISVDCLQKLFFHAFVRVKQRHYLAHANWISVTFLATFALASLSRFVALYLGYGAPLAAWTHISHLVHSRPEHYGPDALAGVGPVAVCMGKGRTGVFGERQTHTAYSTSAGSFHLFCYSPFSFVLDS